MPSTKIPNVPLEIVAGADFNEGFTWQDIDGVAIELTGSTMAMSIKVDDATETTLTDLTTENGGIEILDAEAGKFEINIARAVTATFTPGARLVYDLIRIIDGLHEPVWRGEAVILAGRTP